MPNAFLLPQPPEIRSTAARRRGLLAGQAMRELRRWTAMLGLALLPQGTMAQVAPSPEFQLLPLTESSGDYEPLSLLALGESAESEPLSGPELGSPEWSASDDEANASVTDRLDALERKYFDLEDDYSKLSDEHSELQDELKTCVTSGHDGSELTVYGRIHLDHWAYPGDSPGANAFESGDPNISPQDRLGFRRARIGVQGDLWTTMEYRLEMEFAEGNDVEFRDIYLGWKDLPLLQNLLIGNQKRPYGLDHLNSSRYNVFLERPFVIEAFNQDARRLGIQSYSVSEDLAWNWRYGVFNQRLIQDEGSYLSDHYQLELAGRLANTFWYDESTCGRGYGHWAIAGTAAHPDGSGLPGRATNEARFRTRPEARTESRWIDTGVIDGANDYNLLGLENVWNFGPLQLVGEYQNVWLDRDPATQLRFHGGYFYAAYFLTGEHMPWDRKTGMLDRVEPLTNFSLVDRCDDGVRSGCGAWQVAYRWSFGDFSDDDVLGGVGRSHTLGLNWHWNPAAKMQFNAIYGEIDDHAPVAGQTFGSYAILGTRLMVDF